MRVLFARVACWCVLTRLIVLLEFVGDSSIER